jgi:hypothetical protein
MDARDLTPLQLTVTVVPGSSHQLKVMPQLVLLVCGQIPANDQIAQSVTKILRGGPPEWGVISAFGKLRDRWTRLTLAELRGIREAILETRVVDGQCHVEAINDTSDTTLQVQMTGVVDGRAFAFDFFQRASGYRGADAGRLSRLFRLLLSRATMDSEDSALDWLRAQLVNGYER